MSDPGRQEVTAAETVSLQIPREEKDEIKISDLEHAKKARRKAKLEGHLKAGCGYGKKRQKLLDAFWGIVWSGLEKLGWRKVVGEGKDDGSITFYPPNFQETAKSKSGVDYYDRILDLVDRVLEGRNEEEKKIATAFQIQREKDEPKNLEKAGANRPRRAAALASSAQYSPDVPRARGRPSLGGRGQLDLSWKDGGSLYPKLSSRVGDEYQAVEIPPPGSYVKGAHKELYGLIWDPKSPKSETLATMLDEKIPSNKKEQALEIIGKAGLPGADESIPTLTEVLDQIRVYDGSDWTTEEKDRFNDEIFRLRKDMTALSKSLGKDLKTCLTYFIGKYKKSDRYRLLKTVCAHEKTTRYASNFHGVDACAVCGEGGSLLICDGCEGEYHLGCLRPALTTIPEGHWECDECVDKKLMKAREYIILNSSLYDKEPRNGKKRKADNITPSGGADESDSGDAAGDDVVLRPSSVVLSKMKLFALNINAILAKRPEVQGSQS